MNDNDGDGDPLTVGNPGNRTTTLGVTVNLASDGSFTYTAPTNQVNVMDSFFYYANDGQANSTSATVFIDLRNAIYNGTAANGTVGNWNGGYFPNSITDVVFQSGNIQVSTNMVIRNLQIYNAATFYCTGGATLIVNNSIGNEHRTGMMLSSPLIIK
ncbi:MAG: cadherin-like domain-containing protein, partial [Bacteroidales bacterium]|nr:cadherin-like domain-containing protein [Bacteroidales bacterium]